jgi:CBS domain-containing protein
MLTDPRALPSTATAQDAARLLVRPEVRAVLVVDGDRLLGLVTPAELIGGVVAEGRDPSATALGDIALAEPLTIGPEAPLDEAYRLMEQQDVERLPVTEQGRLVGVLHRSGLQRRLAEDEASEEVAETPG